MIPWALLIDGFSPSNAWPMYLLIHFHKPSSRWFLITFTECFSLWKTLCLVSPQHLLFYLKLMTTPGVSFMAIIIWPIRTLRHTEANMPWIEQRQVRGREQGFSCRQTPEPVQFLNVLIVFPEEEHEVQRGWVYLHQLVVSKFRLKMGSKAINGHETWI